MEQLTKSRASVRTLVSKAVNQISELDKTPEHIVKAKAYKVQFEEKRHELKEMDLQMRTMKLEAKLDLDEEAENAQRYQTTLTEALIKLDDLILEAQQQKIKEDTEKLGLRHVEAVTTKPSQQTARLPPLELQSFDGNIMDWHSFFETFNATIDKRQDLAQIEKLNYLLSLIKGDAKKVISGFSVIEKNYPDIIKVLQQHYDNKEKVINMHINKLLQMKPIYYMSNLPAVKEMTNDINVILRNLANLAINIENCTPILIPRIKEILPQELLLLYERKRQGQEENLEALMAFCREEITLRENSQTTNLNPATPAFQPRQYTPQPYTTTFLTPRQPIRSNYPHQQRNWNAAQAQPRMPARYNNPSGSHHGVQTRPGHNTIPTHPSRFTRPRYPAAPVKAEKACFRCGQSDHFVRNCPQV